MRCANLYPKARITLLIDQHSSELAPAIADVDEVWIYHRKASFRLWLDLVRRGFDLCLDFTGNDRSALVSFLSKAAQRIGFSFVAKRPIRSWVYTRLVQSPVREKHTVDHYMDLVRSLGSSGLATAHVSLRLPDSVERSAETLRREIGLPERYFVVHPGSARPDKYWLADRWKAVIAYGRKRLGMPCLITGGRNPAELQHIRDILAGTDDPSTIFNLAGKVDFLLSAAMIRRRGPVYWCRYCGCAPGFGVSSARTGAFRADQSVSLASDAPRGLRGSCRVCGSARPF